MPNRIIKDSIYTSPNFNKLSPLAERHFYRLLLLPDDFGCCEVTPLVVRGRCYPLQPETTIEQIKSWQKEIEQCDIIKTWSDNGREYAFFLSFSKHQRIRATHQRKTPVPPFDITCRQTPSSDRLNPNPNPNPNPKDIVSGKKEDIESIFNHWNNTEGLMHHKNLTGDMRKAIDNTLQDYSEEDLKTAITNYAFIRNGPEYYFKYKWTLIEFISRRSGNNIERFMDLEACKNNFKRDGKNGQAERTRNNGKDTKPTREERLRASVNKPAGN